MRIHLVFMLLAVFTGFANCSLLELIKRSKRSKYEDKLPKMYWNSPVNLGVYINDDYGYEVTSNAYKRTNTPDDPEKGAGSGGSGGGSVQVNNENKRDKVPKPNSDKANNAAEQRSNANSFESERKTELSANVTHVEEIGEDENAKKQTTVTCQGQKEWLQCPMYHLIKINSGFWGRDDTKTCVRSGIEHGLKTGEICAQDESNTMIKLQNACDGESACELVASPVYFDRTDCPDVYKFMRVNWECAHSESRIKETIEREQQEIARHMATVDEDSH